MPFDGNAKFWPRKPKRKIKLFGDDMVICVVCVFKSYCSGKAQWIFSKAV